MKKFPNSWKISVKKMETSTEESPSINGQRLFNVQNIYGTPQIPRKRPCVQVRPRRMTLIDLRNVSLSEEDVPHRKGSSGTVRSEGGVSQYISKHGILPIYDSSESLDSRRSSTGIKIRRIPSLLDGTTRFPKLEECAHFHYDVVELGTIEAHLCEDDRENYHHNEEDRVEDTFLIRVKSNDKAWNIRRTFSNFRSLDKQLHRCIFDRKFSQLVELQRQDEEKENTDLRRLLRRYLERFSYLAGSMINCGSVLNWLELDNRGNRLLAVDDSGINTPAIAAAHAIKRYNSQAVDEISLEVGDIVSVIDMPPPEDTIWWRGKRGFEVGFFPGECVEVIGDKVPHSMATRILRGAATRKPLIRRHGKLMSFLRTFFSTRPARNQLKQSGIVKERVFGCDLGEHLLNSGQDVPLVLKCCAEVIEEHGIVDGIYRLSGITSNIQKLRLAFDEDSVPDLCDDCYLQDIHSISSLLKMYLRELPNPLLTYQLYDKFAEAVRDEDNRLLRIHDVVQQLPPPHYRTTEYLMKHLAKVAAHGHDTGMHSKNLAIVWAPNLLRSKELEMGGGAAALQGVGIQAVVTECLICYSDIIFSDKMPSYSSPELQKAYKKPRPKSLAISTPTRLLSLEEARERAFVGGLIPVSQKFIDVGGGPENLPAKYHTVIDLPGHKKKSGTPASASKTKKSPVSGWKSIFSKPRSGSIKKARKSSIQDTLNLPPIQGKALTEEDVHNWKKRLRSAKSAESLLSLTSSNRSNNSRKGPENAMVLNVYKEERPHHKRSLSSDATAILHHHSHSAIFFDNGREMPIDVDLAVVPHVMEDEEMSPRRSHQLNREDPGKGSFIRGDSSRMALHHRRTPSAPNTPNQERNSAAKSRQVSHQKASSQPALEDSQVQRRQVYTYIHSSEESLDGDHINGERIPKNTQDEQSAQKRSAKSTPQGNKKTKGNSPESIPKFPKEGVLQLNDSPGAQRKALLELNSKSPDSPSKFFYSRNHDYAEIMSDEDNNKKSNHSLRESDILCSPCDMRDFIEHIDNKFAKHKQSEMIDDSPEKRLSNGSPGSIQNNEQFNRRVTNDDYAQVNKKPKQNGAQTSPVVAGLDYSRIDSRRNQDSKNSNVSTPSANSNSSNGVQNFHSRNKMSKCLSVPSDIAKSLENITVGSNVDLMSSVTISELSQSMDSFNHSFDENGRIVKDPRKRRSASCDSLTAADATMCRTLREINKQIDSAFQQNVDRALQLEEEGYKRHGHSANDIPSLNISDPFTKIIGQRASTHGSFEMVPAYAEVEEPHVELARENPTFLSSIPLDLFENKKTEISKKVKKSQSLDQPMETSGVFGRHNSSSSDSSSEMARIDVTRHLQDKPSLHNQYVISGHAMFPTDDKTPQFPTDLSNQQSHQLQAAPGNFPDYARINKNKNQTTTKSIQGQSDASHNVFVEEFHQNPVVFNVSFDRQNNNSPVYYQLNSPQTISSPSSDASPRPSPRSSPRNLQPTSQQQQPVSPTGYKKPSLPPSPKTESWQTPRTFRRAEEQVGFSQQNVPSLSQSLNLTHDQMIENQLHASASLPEVHVHQDTLTEQKSTIKKSTTESQLTNPVHVQPSYTPVPKPRKLSTEHHQESQQSPHDRMTIDDIKQAHRAVKEGEKVLQMLDSANAGQKLQDLVMEHMEGPTESYSRGRSPHLEAKQPHGANFQTQGRISPAPANFQTSGGMGQAPAANFQSQGGMAPTPVANFQTHGGMAQAPANFKTRGGAAHETDFSSYDPTPTYNITVPSKPNIQAQAGNYQTSGTDYHTTGNKNGGNYQAQGDITRIQVEAYKNFDDAYQTHVEAYPMPSHDSSFQQKLDLYPTHVNASPNQREFASQMRVSPAPRSPRSVAPPSNVTEEKERMTIEDIKQAHKTVREGERALQMMDSSNAGKRLTDVLYEQLPSDIDLVPMQKSKGTEKPIQVPDGSGQFNQLHVDVDFPGNATPSFPSDLSFDPRQVPVLQTAQHQYPKPQHRQEVDVTRHDQQQTQPINFQFAPKFQQVKPDSEQIIYKEPKTTKSKTVYPVKPMEMEENDHMTIEDIKNAHKMVQEGEKVLQMMETSNAGRKMEDLMLEQIGRGSSSSNARNESQSYRQEIPNSYSANEMYSQGRSEKPRFKEELPQSYSNQDMSRYGEQIIASNLRSSMPASFPDNASFVQQTEPIRRQASPKPPPPASPQPNDDEPMTFDDIKRAAKTVKEGEKALKKLDASNAGQKLEDVVMEHVKSGSQAKKKLQSTHDSDESPKNAVKMSSSYTESSNLTQTESQMSSSWSGPNSSEKPPKSIFIPANKLPATLIESRCEKTAPSPIGEITESQMLQIETFGDIDHEEFQNEVERGKAIIAADKERLDAELLPTPDTLPFSTSQDCKIVPQQPIVVCRANDVPNVNVPHGDILRAPSFIASAVQKPYTSVPSPKKRSPVKTVLSDVPPPEHEVMEVTRPSVIFRKPKSKKEPPMVSPKPTVQSSGSESSDSKHKERKNIPAQKHSQLSRQMAEVADEGSDSVTTEKSSTGPSDAEFTCVSSTDDDVFTDFSDGSNFLRRKKLIENRDFDFRASLGKMERKSSETVKIPTKVVDEMISSRSSLDESLLTLAAERHDIFSPEREEEPTFNTGSLRVKRSQKLKSLVELFESVSDTNDSDSSPVTRPKDQRHLTSSQPSIPTHTSDTKYEADTDEEVTQPRVRPSSVRLRSRSRSRDRARKTSGLGSDKENSLKSRSPTPNRKSAGSERSSREIERLPSSPSDSSSDYKSRKQKTKSEKYSSMGKPPRYRSNSRTRTHSESSTSESEGSLHHDSALIRRLNESEVILRDQNRSELCQESVEFLETVENRARSTQKSAEEAFPEKCDLQRRGSIKELREFFECRKSDIEQEESTPSPVIQPRLPRDRIKSSSPASFEHPQRSEKGSPSTLRYSLELPSGSSLSHSEGVLKTQTVRLGPKPFYGSKK